MELTNRAREAHREMLRRFAEGELGVEPDGTIHVDRATHVVFDVEGEQYQAQLERDDDGNYHAPLDFYSNSDDVTVTFYQGPLRRIAGPIPLNNVLYCLPGDTARFWAGRMKVHIDT